MRIAVTVYQYVAALIWLVGTPFKIALTTLPLIEVFHNLPGINMIVVDFIDGLLELAVRNDIATSFGRDLFEAILPNGVRSLAE